MKCRVLLSALALLLPISAQAAWIIQDGVIKEVTEAAWLSPQEHFDKAMAAWNSQDWDEAVYQFRIVTENFPVFTNQHGEIQFYLGAGLYYQGELDAGNDQLTKYLKESCSPELLEEAMDYKFAIAEQYRCGAKRRFFGYKRMPKWVCGKTHAIQIYDEIVSTLPCHDLAAQALYSKGMLLCELKDFQGSVEAYQSLIRRFPLHELAPESYLTIIQVYLQQAHCEYQNPDILALAEIVLRRFMEDFPNEERLCDAESQVKEIKEVFAYGLYETGVFYEKVKKPHASALYYSSAIRQFPDTGMAASARDRLNYLLKCNPGLVVPEGTMDACQAL
ncbi:MAG: tetratricopeptide repeat protein [Chlamydiales bacterium]|nr:tetratricopeptide repeat protein [Chlamydiales bacterium]